MLRILCFLTFLILVNNAFAQKAGSWCGTVMENYASYRLDKQSKNFDASGLRLSGITYYVPLKLHIVRQTNGTGGIPLDDVFYNLCELNESYDSMGIQFYIYGDIHYISNSALYSWDSGGSEGNTLMNNYNVSNVCNVYLVGGVTGLCGYAFMPGTGPNGGGMVLINGCVGVGNTTWQHEMGHYMSLPHTFECHDGGGGGWFGCDKENVARSGPQKNCGTAGDYFCDTHADPIPDRWSCPYTGGAVDDYGVPYTPDAKLFMSYAADACTNYFSDQQKDACVDALVNDRPNLLIHPTPSLATITGLTNAIQPIASATVPANYVEFKWNSVPGAELYVFQCQRMSGGVSDKIEIFTTDTFYTAIEYLTFGLYYKWNVRAITRLHPCSSPSPFQMFFTGPELDSIPGQIIGINENNNGNFVISPNTILQGSSFAINLPYVQPIELQIIDANGKLVQQYSFPNASNSHVFNTQNIDKGMYFVRVASTSEVKILKIVVL